MGENSSKQILYQNRVNECQRKFTSIRVGWIFRHFFFLLFAMNAFHYATGKTILNDMLAVMISINTCCPAILMTGQSISITN